MLPNHLEKILYHYILDKREFLQFTKENFFETPNYSKIFQAAKAFIDKYDKVPTKNQLVEIIKIKGWGDNINRDFIDTLYNVNLEQYDPEWLNESAEAWVEFKNLDKSVESLVTFLKTTKVDAGNVKTVVETAKDIIVNGNNLDFKFDEGLDFFNPECHIQPTNDTFSTGFSYLDTVLGGGWSTKALYVIAGENKVGKSIWLANLAAAAVRLGYNSAVVSLEMRDRHVVKRLGANMLGIKMDEYTQLAQDQDAIRKRLATVGYDGLQIPGKLWVKEYPTSSASIKDVERYLVKMEQMKGIKFKTIFIDYINILMNWRNPNSENMYLKIKQIAEDMRAMGTRNNWAVITLTQLNRCLALDTLVETRNGMLRIDKLIEGDEILTPEGFAPVTKVYPKEKQKVYKIITKSGKEIKVSGRHLTPTSDGRLLTVHNLMIGDKILCKSEKSV